MAKQKRASRVYGDPNAPHGTRKRYLHELYMRKMQNIAGVENPPGPCDECRKANSAWAKQQRNAGKWKQAKESVANRAYTKALASLRDKYPDDFENFKIFHMMQIMIEDDAANESQD